MSQTQKEPQLVFIVGSGRSGTTLLRNILDMHPRVGVTPELRFFDLTLSSRKKFKDLKSLTTRGKFIERIIKKISQSGDPLWKSIDFESTNFRDQLNHSQSFKDLFLNLAKLTSSKNNPEILIEKTPVNIFFLEQILNFFPKARVIHILRDGREVCASAKKKNWSESNINLAAWWRDSILAFDKIKKKFPEKSNKFLEIKYENLIQDPKETLTEIFSFFNFGSLSGDFLDNLKNLTSYSSFFEDATKGLYTSSHFKEYFFPREQKEIETLLHPYLKKKGYSLDKKKSLFSFSLELRMLFESLKISTNLWFRRKGYFWLYSHFKKLFKK